MERLWAKLVWRIRPSSRLVLFFILLFFFWTVYVIKIQLDFHKHADKDYLRARIVELSKEYLRIVAEEKKEEALAIDGQTTAELQDLRKTTAVLLQNMLDRLQILESQVNNVVSQSASDISQLWEHVKSLNESIWKMNSTHDSSLQECKIVNDPKFPKCAEKVEWMLNNWQTDKKFSMNGVNGTMCSIIFYLSEVENWCPMLPGRQKIYEDDCKVPVDPNFPNCAPKVAWMRSFWRTDTCYAQEYGVNGTVCSFLYYLSEVESWCPMFPGRHSVVIQQRLRKPGTQVNLNRTTKEVLLDRLTNVVAESRLAWIRARVGRMYSYWVDGLRKLRKRINLSDKPLKKVIVHIGVLAEEKSLHFAETAGKGGPLGELVQWCDLITSLYVLGHDVRITVDHQDLLKTLDVSSKRACPPKAGYRYADLIFTDYYGLAILKKKANNLLDLNRCRLRILDSFGTEVQFNYNGPLPKYGSPVSNGNELKFAFGKNNLNLKQYMTMFPHSPDNTFLGFVVDSAQNVPKSIQKKPQALAYGKHFNMWKDLTNRQFLDIIHENFEIHTTTGGMHLNAVNKYLPKYVINHGVVTFGKLQTLLRDSKLFIGIGFPYEGPAPLEAIAQGCVFLNPKFNPPKNRENTKFFNGKPTFRSLTSQHPYAEEFIGEPRVLTVDINNPSAVKDAMKKVVDSQPSPYLPFEYTHEGMLERINALIHNQDFCNSAYSETQWPPVTSRTVVVGKEGQSCKNACLAKGLVCEPAYFKSINNATFLKMGSFPCGADKTMTRSSLVAPAYVGEEKLCVLQATPALYSCTAFHPTISRVCPCRDYRKGQVALCKTCY